MIYRRSKNDFHDRTHIRPHIDRLTSHWRHEILGQAKSPSLLDHDAWRVAPSRWRRLHGDIPIFHSAHNS